MTWRTYIAKRFIRNWRRRYFDHSGPAPVAPLFRASLFIQLYFMVPALAAALLYMPDTQKWAVYAAVFGAVIALITSYGLGFGWWKIEGANLSLANRIYNGFTMSALLLVALLVARHSQGVFRMSAGVVAVLIGLQCAQH